jgi:hypothetical protein
VCLLLPPSREPSNPLVSDHTTPTTIIVHRAKQLTANSYRYPSKHVNENWGYWLTHGLSLSAFSGSGQQQRDEFFGILGKRLWLVTLTRSRSGVLFWIWLDAFMIDSPPWSCYLATHNLATRPASRHSFILGALSDLTLSPEMMIDHDSFDSTPSRK